MDAFVKEVSDVTINESDYQRFAAIIQAAKAEKKVEVLRRSARAAAIPDNDVRSLIQMAQNSMESSDWSDAEELYEQLHFMDLGPKSVATKLALCKALTGYNVPAFKLCKQAMIDGPSDSSAYLAMAIIKGRLGQRLDSEKFLKLAEIALNPNLDLIAETRKDNQFRTERGMLLTFFCFIDKTRNNNFLILLKQRTLNWLHSVIP